MRHTPPGPKGLPGIGNSHRFVSDPLGFITACQQVYGDIAQIEIGGEKVYLVMNPESIKQVLSIDGNKYKKPEYHPNMHDLFGDGMLIGNGESWIQQRQRAQPSFKMDRLENLVSVMVNYTKNTMSEWSAGDVLHIDYEMPKLALKIVSKAMFEYELEDGEIRSLIQDMETIGQQLEPNVNDMITPPWLPTQGSRKHQNAASNIDELLNTIIRDRGRTEVDGDGMDYLSSLLQDHPRSVDKQRVRDEMMTILLAGNDTTATVMSFAWYLIACHPEVEARLHDELASVLSGKPPTAGDLRNLNYTECVLKEAMRLYPPVYSVLRESIEEAELDGYPIPSGSLVMLPQWGVQRDARWYDDPETFDPDRWSDKRVQNRPEYAYFPFGGGARRCIGEKFAMMEAKIVLSLIAQKYRLELVSDNSLKLVPSITLHPDEPIEMTVSEQS